MILFSTLKKINDSPFLCLFNSPLWSSEAGLKRWEHFEPDKIEHHWLLSLLQSALGHTASPELPSGAWARRLSLCTSFEFSLWPGVGGFLAPGFINSNIIISSVQFGRSIVSDSLQPHKPYQLLEFTQTHIHWVGDAMQPSHPLMYHSPSAFNLSQHQGLFQWVSPLHQVAQVLEFQLQYQSFQWTPKTGLL